MARDTGENQQALRKIMDMSRLISIALLLLHSYYYGYALFAGWGYRSGLTDNLLRNIQHTGLFHYFHTSKLLALGFLIISLIGIKGSKNEKLRKNTAIAYISCGCILYFISYLFFLSPLPRNLLVIGYMLITGIGYLLLLTGGSLLSRIIQDQLKDDIFNIENETFPQEERLITNEASINLPTQYIFRGKQKAGWINLIIPYAATLIAGRPGAGKSVFVIREFIAQALAKVEPYTMFIYDFKFPDLSLIAYNHFLKNKHRYLHPARCYFINFDDLTRSHRGNPLDPHLMMDITDANESARTILLGLNREWQKKQGDFFVESAINFLTAVIWFLRLYKQGKFCTLPHAIEFISLDYNSMFTLLNMEPTISTLVSPYINAYLNNVMEQLEGQIGSAKIALARLASPQLYYVLSGSDFSLDINNPEAPKLICMGNNPQKIQVYGAVISLYVNRLLKVINQKGKLKSMLVFDEFPTVTTDIIPTIATGRSNKIAVVMGIQDLSQLRKDYGKDQADVIMNTVGNIISGQVTGESAKTLSERIGKINQDRQSLSINDGGTSISKSKQLELAVPASRISSLSSGEFVGMVADTPQQPIQLKAFHGRIVNSFEQINEEEKNYQPIPVIRQIDQSMVMENYRQIRQDVQDIASMELERLLSDPSMVHLVIRK